MSDSVDRVFVHALATVRRLPRTGSSRPPPASRLRLYGLYKQSMEGDVASILPRPTLPVASPDQSSSTALHKYASRDLRTREAQAEIEKWDAWDACKGVSRTDAKREYVGTLIETMKEYASGTPESRELVGELEFVWNQIRGQRGSEPDANVGSGDGSLGEIGDKESPTRKAERAGLGLGRVMSGSEVADMSLRSSRASLGSTRPDMEGSRQGSGRQLKLKRTESGLRVLSPISQGDDDSVVEPVDELVEDEDREFDNDEDEILNTAPTSPLADRSRHRNLSNVAPPQDPTQWQQMLEAHLHALKTEIAALREQLAANHLLSSSTFSHTYYTMSTRQRIIHRAKLYVRTFGLMFLKQVILQLGVLAVVLLWGRLNGDLRIEDWVRDAVTRFWKRLRQVSEGLLFWLFDLFSRNGRLSFVGRILRVF